MLPFQGLHALAAGRGDGLRPELLDLFSQNPGIRGGAAGPTTNLPATMGNVVAFPKKGHNKRRTAGDAERVAGNTS